MKRPVMSGWVFFLGLPLAGSAGDLAFEIRQLGEVDQNEGCAIADIDQDGIMDVVAGRHWYRGPDFKQVPLRTIEDWNGYVQSNGDFIHDVNEDGFPDVVAGSFIPTEVMWYRNPGKDHLLSGQLWGGQVLIDTRTSQNEGSFLRDMDGDGVPEWITNSWNGKNPVKIYRFGVPDPAPVLVEHTIGFHGQAHGMGFGDLNMDGREDLLVGSGWYERPPGDIFSTPWTFHRDWDSLHASVPMLVKDLNGDGRNDVIWGKGHDFGLYWWESKGMSEGAWTWEEHLIDKEWSQPHSMLFADLDGDGEEELITGKRVRAHNGKDPGGTEPACLYFYRWHKNENRFTRHVIDEGRVGTGLQIAVGDLNNDQRLDIAVAGKSGTFVILNQGKKP